MLITQGKTNYKYLSIIFLMTILVGGLIWQISDLKETKIQNNNVLVRNEINDEEPQNIEEPENKMSDEEVMKLFQATEIVSNNLPDSIEFWTEAYCPGSGTNYDYKFHNIKMYEYTFDSCVEDDFGTHGGCKTCMMSKIKIKKTPESIEHIKLKSFPFDCGKASLLREEDGRYYSYYEILFKITDRVKIKMNARGFDSSFPEVVDSFSILDGDKEISSYNVEFYSEKPRIYIFDYNNKKYFLIFGGEYGNKAGTSQYFLYVIKDDGCVEPVKNSWGGTFSWQCDDYREGCSLDYAFGYKDNLYLLIGGDIWEFDKYDKFKDRIYASAITFNEGEINFIKAKKEKPVAYLGFCGTNIEKSGVLTGLEVPNSLGELNYGELVVNEELCKKINWMGIFSSYCIFEPCREKGVIPDSAADKAGIVSGDIILELDSKTLKDGDMDKILSEHNPGDSVVLKVLRNGEIILINAILGQKPKDLNPSFGDPSSYIKEGDYIEEMYENCTKAGIPLPACLAKGTKITMADGSHKNIEEITESDLVKSFDLATKEFKIAKVKEVITRKDPIVTINNILKIAPDEPIYLADRTIKTAIELKVGEILFNNKKITSIDYSSNLVDTYDLILENADNFFAEEYLVLTPDF